MNEKNRYKVKIVLKPMEFSILVTACDWKKAKFLARKKALDKIISLNWFDDGKSVCKRLKQRGKGKKS